MGEVGGVGGDMRCMVYGEDDSVGVDAVEWLQQQQQQQQQQHACRHPC